MRKMDHTKRYSADDLAWLRMAGSPYFNSLIEANAREFKYDPNTGVDIPEDTTTQGTVGDEAVVQPPAPVVQPPAPVDPATTAARRVDPTEGGSEGVSGEDADDDYDQWKVAELENEVKARDKLSEDREGVTPVTVVGTGKDGNVTKADLIKGLRLWDAENPDVLDD